MKHYTFITLEQLLASYMVKFETNKVSKVEIKRWANYLSKRISNKQKEAIALHYDIYEKEIKQERIDYFVVENGNYYLTNGVTVEDLDNHIISYMHIELIMAFLDAKDYIPRSDTEMLIR